MILRIASSVMASRAGRLGSGSEDCVALVHVGAATGGALLEGLAAAVAGRAVSAYVTPEHPARAPSPATRSSVERRRHTAAGGMLIGTPRSVARHLGR